MPRTILYDNTKIAVKEILGVWESILALGPSGAKRTSASCAPGIVRPVLPSQTAQLSRAMAWLSICAVVGQDWYALRR